MNSERPKTKTKWQASTLRELFGDLPVGAWFVLSRQPGNPPLIKARPRDCIREPDESHLPPQPFNAFCPTSTEWCSIRDEMPIHPITRAEYAQ